MTTPQFALFNSPVDLAHHFFKSFLKPHDRVIDATLGHGKDSQKILSLIPQGFLYGFDIQEKAILSAQKKLGEVGQNFKLFCVSHSHFPEELKKETIRLIIYNLGYLPGEDKSITTLSSSTLESCQQAWELLAPFGVLSIMCYPGHEEGAKEEKVLVDWASSLDKKLALVTDIALTNRIKAPRLLLIQKKIT